RSPRKQGFDVTIKIPRVRKWKKEKERGKKKNAAMNPVRMRDNAYVLPASDEHGNSGCLSRRRERGSRERRARLPTEEAKSIQVRRLLQDDSRDVSLRARVSAMLNPFHDPGDARLPADACEQSRSGVDRNQLWRIVDIGKGMGKERRKTRERGRDYRFKVQARPSRKRD
ncbi:hypothetical protein EW146_g10412, partial [Bondarzewia mesenterica]